MQAKFSNNKSASGRSICPYCDEIDAIIGTRAATHPHILLESGGSISNQQMQIYKVIYFIIVLML